MVATDLFNFGYGFGFNFICLCHSLMIPLWASCYNETMNQMQFSVILAWGVVGLVVAGLGIHMTVSKKRVFKETKLLLPWGIFVWGDAPLIGGFWFLASLIAGLAKSLDLFGLISCLFWAVRSYGEIIYWINQQFSTVRRNPPEKLWGYQWFGDDSIWFVYQLAHQLILIASLVGVIFFSHQWLLEV